MVQDLIIKIGADVFFQGTIFQITRLIDICFVLARNKETGEIKRLNISELKPLPADTDVTSINKEDIYLLSDEEWQKAQYRFAIILPVLNDRGNGELVKNIANTNNINRATIYRWIEKYENTGQVSSLVDYKRGAKSETKLPEEVEAIITGSIEEIYLTKQQKSIEKVCLDVIIKCKQAGFKPPHPNTIRKRVRGINEKRRITLRNSKFAASSYEPILSSFPDADYPLSAVQIDHTKLDIILVDETYRRPIGRPWITLAMDVYSRVVAGFYISFDPPGALGTGQCLSHAILPKEQWLSKFDVISGWPLWGIMKSIYLDNAKEFKGNTLKRACEEYGIKINWRPVKKPNWGGHIERLLGTFLKEIHDLPGTTFSNPSLRKFYNSEAEAVFTLKEFEEWLTIFIVDVYHQRKHQKINMPPIAKLNEGYLGNSEKPGIGLPPRIFNDLKLRLDFLPYIERTIQRYGIYFEKIQYYSDVLRKWINAKTPDKKNKRKFIFKIDPRDVSLIYFYDPDLKDYFHVTYRDISKPPITIWELKAIKRKLDADGSKNYDEEAIFNAIEKLRRLEDNAKSLTKKTKRIKNISKRHHSFEKSVKNDLPKIIEETKKGFDFDTSNLKPFNIIEDGVSE